MQAFSRVTDEDLLHGLHELAGSQRRVMADLVLHLAEVDARRRFANKGFPSLFSYCVEELRFSEDEACRRIEAARLVRRFPSVDELLKTGAVTLTVLGLLKPHLTTANHAELLAGVSGASVRRAKEWIAARFPQPDVPWSIRKRPERSPVVHELRSATLPAPTQAIPGPATLPAPTQTNRDQAVPPWELARATLNHAANPFPRSGRAEPLSRDRFLVKLTVSRSVRDKLELARDMMSHGNPSGDLAVVVERALDALLEELQEKKLGGARNPERKRRRAKRTRVANATRREVVARDGLGCSFVAPDGRCCGARSFLEFDHETPRARGGGSEPDNVRLLCRSHNFLAAARVYGTEHMQRAVSESRTENGREIRERLVASRERPADATIPGVTARSREGPAPRPSG